MASNAITTLVQMVESLPESAQEQVVEHLREYIEDLRDEREWELAFQKNASRLRTASRKVKQEIEAGNAQPMDEECLHRRRRLCRTGAGQNAPGHKPMESGRDDFDPRLVLDANRSFWWIFHSAEIARSSPTSEVGRLLMSNMHDGKCDLINPGLALAAAYIYFVYPKEMLLGQVDLTGVDVSCFQPSLQAQLLIRRLRNSLAHGRFRIDNDGRMTFEDIGTQGQDPFTTAVYWAAFGMFVQEYGRRAVRLFQKHTG